MTDRAGVVAEARRWIGTPYRHQGRVFGVGIDCVGLVICVAKNLGLVSNDFDVRRYPKSPDGVTLIATANAQMTEITKEQMQPGDVAVLKWHKDPQHMGIVADYLHGGLSLVHAYGTPDGRGTVVEQRLNDSMLKRLVAVYRLPGLD